MLRAHAPILSRWILCLAAFFATLRSPAAERTLAEYQIKALFIFNFVQFAEWPSRAFASPQAPFAIGILGDNPFGDALDVAIKGEKIAGRPLIVTQGRTLEALKDCQLIFVSRSERARMDTIIEGCTGKPVLTVADTPGFAERGGILNFYLEGEKVRFEVNRGAAQRADLKLSAQLLRLARLVGNHERDH